MSERKFKLFDFNKDGKGVDPHEDDGPPNLARFFKQYKRKFSRLLSVNIFMVLGCFPVFFIGLAIAWYGAIDSSLQTSSMFPAMYTLSKFAPSPITDALNSVYSVPSVLTVNTTVTYVLFALSLLLLITFGLTNVGTTYILRNLAKGDPVFMWSDFWYAIKRNLKQGIIMGIIDLLCSGVLVFNVSFYFQRINGTFLAGIMFYISLAMVILWFFMRFLLVTFDLSIFKILKNALIFAIIGFKRNIMATLGILVLVILNLMVFMYIPSLGIVLPLVITLSNGAFMSTDAAWFKIKEIMIDPYEDENKKEEDIDTLPPLEDITQ